MQDKASVTDYKYSLDRAVVNLVLFRDLCLQIYLVNTCGSEKESRK